MGLGGEFFECQLGLLQRLALGPERGIAQARAALFALAAPVWALAAALAAALWARIAEAAIAWAAVVAARTRAAGLRLRPRHAGPVVASHGHQLAWGGGGRSWGCWGFARGLGGCGGGIGFGDAGDRVGVRIRVGSSVRTGFGTGFGHGSIWRSSIWLGRLGRHGRRGLPAQTGLQGLAGGADALRIARRTGGFQCLRGLQHRLIVGAQRGGNLLALGRLALKSGVDGLAKRLPEFLFQAPIQRHRLRFLLPALLQGLHGVDAQRHHLSQGLRLGNQGLTALHALILRRF